eukprot:153560_1
MSVNIDHLLYLIGCLLLLFKTNHSQQILVVHTNQTHSSHSYQSINNTLCIVPQNESNPKSFLSYYILTNNSNNNIEDYLNIKTTPILFYHIIHINDLPYSCIKQIQTQNNKVKKPMNTKTNQNINYLQIPINNINHINNKIFVQDETTLDSSCPTQAWDFFIWSLKEWYLIYIFVLLLGIIIGSIMIIIIVFCCWKYKKQKFIQQIISDHTYKNKIKNKKLKNGNNLSNSSSTDSNNNIH